MFSLELQSLCRPLIPIVSSIFILLNAKSRSQDFGHATLSADMTLFRGLQKPKGRLG
jgi:hypothetical protein